jgi:phospholipase/lecithinase/hemolysin
MEQEPITEKRVIEIVMVELEQYKKAIAISVAQAIALNNAKIEEQLKELGIIK